MPHAEKTAEASEGTLDEGRERHAGPSYGAVESGSDAGAMSLEAGSPNGDRQE